MQTYRLEYKNDRFGVEKAIEFEARSAAGALDIAQKEAKGRWARLYEDGRAICRLERANSDSNIWLVATGDREAHELS